MAWGVAERLQPTPPGKTRLKRRQSFWARAVMKNLFLGSLALAAMIAGPATAADLPYKAPPPLPVAYYDWSGIYGGFNVGGARYDVTHHFPTPGAITPDVTTGDSDAIFGLHVGAQWQWGAWVFGVEAARIGCFNECRSRSDILPVAQGFDANTFGEHKITNLFTAGPRLGYAWDRLLVFATGGWTWANIVNTHCSSITNICGGFGPGNGVSSSNNGWYAGGGFDYMVHKGALVDVILGVEYQHFDVNGARAFCVHPGCAPPAVRDFDLSATGDLVRARVTIKTQGYLLAGGRQ
jgi:outer membrane immunogenic protein